MNAHRYGYILVEADSARARYRAYADGTVTVVPAYGDEHVMFHYASGEQARRYVERISRPYAPAA